MRTWVVCRLAPIVRPRHDLTIAHDDSAAGNLPLSRCRARLFKRHTHVVLVIHSITRLRPFVEY